MWVEWYQAFECKLSGSRHLSVGKWNQAFECGLSGSRHLSVI